MEKGRETRSESKSDGKVKRRLRGVRQRKRRRYGRASDVLAMKMQAVEIRRTREDND